MERQCGSDSRSQSVLSACHPPSSTTSPHAWAGAHRCTQSSESVVLGATGCNLAGW
jgi:hypothetical protein